MNIPRFIISIIGFALFIVGCNSMVPTTERIIELPTRQYQQYAEPDQKQSRSLGDSEVVRAIRTACRSVGEFTIVHEHTRERYTCKEQK